MRDGGAEVLVEVSAGAVGMDAVAAGVVFGVAGGLGLGRSAGGAT